MKQVLFTLIGIAIGLLISNALAESRLIRISEHVGDYVTSTQNKQHMVDGCFVVVQDLIAKDIKNKKALGITE
jgi:hypothetical protein